MADPSNTLSDRNLEASTTLSLKREPACFAFLCSRAVSAPLPVDAINLDLASVDYFSGRASLWATLEVRSGATKLKSEPLEMVFIRAPLIDQLGPDVEVLATDRGQPVLVRQGKKLIATFHPELSDDTTVHEYFLKLAAGIAPAPEPKPNP